MYATNAQAIAELKTLSLFRDILEKDPCKALVKEGGAEPDGAAFLYSLTKAARLWTAAPYRFAAHPVEAWLIHSVLTSDNLWSRLIERKVSPGPLLDAMARRDLAVLSRFRAHSAALIAPFSPAWPHGHWQAGAHEPHGPLDDAIARIVAAFCQAVSWESLLPELAAFIERAGAGIFNSAIGFRWTADAAEPLQPVTSLDDVRLEHLIGQREEREKVVRNTERLVAGLPAHNVLLYGDRGTGKSATVKALAHRYGPRGLRLVELPKGLIHTLPQLVSELSGRGLSFIIFIDDLSFEAAETEYKELKAFLEGSLASPAPNVRVYATTNRRHLVREEFTERGSGRLGTADDEVRRQDTVQEKLSLADRFGLTVIFPTPSQQHYLDIVRFLARMYNVEMDDRELTERALRWAAWQNGRSGRTAKQFIDELRGGSLEDGRLPK